MRSSSHRAASTLRLAAAVAGLLVQGIPSPSLALSQITGCELQPSSSGRSHAARLSESAGGRLAAGDSRTSSVAPADPPTTLALPIPCAIQLLTLSTRAPARPHLDPPRFARGPPALLGR